MERRFFAEIDADDADQTFDPPLEGIYILAEGNLSWSDGSNTFTKTFPASSDAGGAYPFDLKGKITKIFNTATTIADVSLVGYRY